MAEGEIASDARRAGELIRGLLDLYREHKADYQPVDMIAVADDTLRLLRSEFVIQGVKISAEHALTCPAVDGMWVQIQQVLVNLIMNGMNAMKETAARNREIRVLIAHDAREVRAWARASEMYRRRWLWPGRISAITPMCWSSSSLPL